MAFDELVKYVQNRTNFHMQKRVHIHQLTKLLTLSKEEHHHPSWNCIIVPHREICHLIRSQTGSRSDYKGEFMALLLTRSHPRTTHHPHVTLRDWIHPDKPTESTHISTWIMKLIYIARGMGLLVKPIFRFDTSTIQTAMNISPEQKIFVILLVGYPEETETELFEAFPGYVHFHTTSTQHIEEGTVH